VGEVRRLQVPTAPTRGRTEFVDAVRPVEEMTDWAEAHYQARKADTKLVEDKANGPAVIS
jgi:hypothetical protein